jgi:hypothetical protein
MDEHADAGGVPVPQERDPRFRWYCPKPTVRILFYTDDTGVNLSADVEANEFGVRILRDLLVQDESDVADFDVTLLNRHFDAQGNTQGANKLTPTQLEGFDQVWFFGTRLADTPGQPDNELTDSEVAALEQWMVTGGVLMTGDHANERPDDADPHLDNLLGLGRAIGHRVPRAGSLRRWEGGPPQFDIHGGMQTFNTQVPTPQVPDDQLDTLEAQMDEWPQELLLKTYPLPSAGPLHPSQTFGRQVHRLFCGRAAPIKVFPDHMHEGQLVLPSTFPHDSWPSGPGGQPVPEVIARGTDKRSFVVYDILTVYDGISAGVGRIVADSTWHHYFNVNLLGFSPAGHVLPQLAQYYVNLAVWLSPPAKLRAIACWQRWKLAHNATVQMTSRRSLIGLGRVAAGVLRRTAGPCAIRDLVGPVGATGTSPADALEPPPELLLGGVMQAYLEAFERADAGDERTHEMDIDALLVRGSRAAHEDFVTTLRKSLAGAERARDLFEDGGQTGGGEIQG